MSNTEFLSILNDAYQDINSLEAWPYLEKIVTGTSTSGTAALFASTLDIKQVLSLINTTQGYELTPYDTDQFYKNYSNSLTTAGLPSIYYLTVVDAAAPMGWNVATWPVPNNSSDTYQLRYLYIPATLAIGDTPVIPERFHRILVTACLAELYDQEDDDAASTKQLNKLDRKLRRMREDLWSKEYDRQDSISDITEQDGGHLGMIGWY